MQDEIYTERLVLKVINETAALAVLDYVIRNKEFLQEWEVERKQDYYTLETQSRQLIDEHKKVKNNEMFKVWLFKQDDPNRVIGSVAITNIIKGAFQSCHLGYRLDKDECNKGYMTEALREVISYAFDELHLHRIEANIMPRNEGSRKLVENIGFYPEGLALKYLKINGKWEDHIHMVLRNHDLEENPDVS